MRIAQLKKYIFLFVVSGFAILFIPLYPVYAKDSTPSAKNSTASSSMRQQKLAQARGTVKDQLEIRKESIATREAALKEKLAKFRDKNKAATVERINAHLVAINKKRTDEMTSFLSRTSQILTKLETRVTKIGSEGKDTTQSLAAIANAKTAIATAQTAVLAQSQNEYIITISTEAKAKEDTKVQVTKLQTDLRATKATVTTAKQAVANAIRISATTLKGTN